MTNESDHSDNIEHSATNAWTILDRAGQIEFPSNDPSIAEIWGYTDALTYSPGEDVRLFVHTTAASFDFVVYRDGKEKQIVYSREGNAGILQVTPEDAYETGCDWRETASFQTSADWRSGVYIIILKTQAPGDKVIEREAFFVLRSLNPGKDSSIVYILPTATYTAYNDWGGANHYRRVQEGRPLDLPAPVLSLNRPFARGMLRLPIGAPRYSETPTIAPGGMPRYPWLEWAFAYDYCRHYADAGWAMYDLPFVEWAEGEGYQFDFLTQYDLHESPDCLDPYRAAVIVGHDEYWTWEMRDTIDQFVNAGGKLARFAGNFLWQIRLENNGRTQISHKLESDDPFFGTDQQRFTTTLWDAKTVGRLGAETLGLTGIGGTLSRLGTTCPRASGALTVYRPDHWVFADTDLYYADQFGGAPSYIVSFEVDGLDYTFRNGLPYPTYKDGAPESLEILAMTPTAGFLESDRREEIVNCPKEEMLPFFTLIPLAYETTQADVEFGSAMVAIFDREQGTVFNAGCTEWVSGLIKRDFFVEQITRNVLNKFGTST